MQPMVVDMAMILCALLIHNTLQLNPKQGFLSLDTPPDFDFRCGAHQIKFIHVTLALPRGVDVGTLLPFY